MEIKNKIKIEIYEDIYSNYEILNGWKNTYNLNNKLNYNEHDFTEFQAIELSFLGYSGGSKQLFESFNSFLKKYVLSIPIQTYIVKTETKEKLKNRVRSYKGLFNGVERDQYFQKEVDFENNTSILQGISIIVDVNIEAILEMIYDSSSSFIISSSENIFSVDFLQNVLNYQLKNYKTHDIDYLRLIKDRCEKKDLILRIGGDGGDQEVTFQLFGLKDTLDNELTRIKRLLDVNLYTWEISFK